MTSWIKDEAQYGPWYHYSRQQAKLWRITRFDGTVLRFTDADRVIWFGSEQFFPSDDTVSDQTTGGVEGVTVRREAGLRETTTQVSGLISSGRITHDDLLSGRYDNATVDEIWVDTRWPWISHVTKKYVIEKLSFRADGAFQAEITSRVNHELRKTRGRVHTRNCQHELFDSRCNAAAYGGSVPFDSNHWLVGHDTATWCSVATVLDEHSFDVTLPTGTITGISASPTIAIAGGGWLNADGNVWQVGLVSAHGYTSGQTFRVVFSGVTGMTPTINGVSFTVTANGSTLFLVNLEGYSGTPSGGTVYIGTTTITCSGGHPFGYSGAPYPYTAKMRIGVRGVGGGSPSINGAYSSEVEIASATQLKIPIATSSAGSGGTVSFEPEAEWFKNGKLTWSRSTDDNYLEVGTIRYSEAAGTSHPVTIQVDLLVAPGKPASVGDKCSLLTGCRLRLVQDCSEKFSNVANFGGSPSMPSSQRLVRTPDAL